ncbi:HAD family hydrolase [Rhizobium sp. NRK18]|uniref:HAD family hydrolase n=1 Tax=Rhizobium sp. NRK18 TaxID=2964667 RepID=UPI0021C39E8C|nr:HAD family hydrolase [Rhizobium sp. NRK18]MCQ2003594.1 HAD hydrolase-like protein [Rhizobium sp. NRK18]
MRLFFDVDGVLIDGWHVRPELRKPWDVTIEADLGVDRVALQRQLFAGEGGPAPMADCITGRRDLADVLAEVLPRTGYRGSVSDFMRYWFEKDSNLNAAVFSLVKRLRTADDIQLFVATGQEHHRARYLWEDLKFSEHFDGLFYSADIGFGKKDRRFFETINERLGLEPDERPLFFDDQKDICDIAAACGWDATEVTSADDIRNHPRLTSLW